MFDSILRQVAEELAKRHVSYMVIGGQAVLVYGEPRATKDIDITLGIGPDQVDVILDLVRVCGWRVRPESPHEFARQHSVLPCEDPSSGVLIDFIFSYTPYETQALRRTRPVDFNGVSVHFASPEDIVIHKVVAGRPRDIEDARWIIKKNADLDLAYLRDWIKAFEVGLQKPLMDQLENILA